MQKIKYILLLVLYIQWGCTHTHNHSDNNLDEHSHEETTQQTEHEKHDHESNVEEEGHDHESDINENHDHESEEDEDHEHESDTHEDHEEIDALYGVVEITPQSFHEIIRTSGQILSAQGDEVTLTAFHEGVVVFHGNQLFSGTKVNNGELLLTISGKELIHDNIESSFQDIKSEFEKAQMNYERAVALNKDKIISDKELLDSKIEFDQKKNKYQLVKRNYSSGGQKLTANITGYVKDVMVSEGQFVVTGQPLLKLTKNKRLVIKAEVPQRYFHMLNKIQSANFITVYDKQFYDIKDLKGQLVSFGKTTGENSLFTPVYFEIDNKGDLLAGSYIEVFLKTVELPGCIVLPKSALMEESGRFYVYAEGQEDFEKRYVQVDCNNGEQYHITKGLEPGDHVVTLDPYRIKLSSLSSALPAHSHSH